MQHFDYRWKLDETKFTRDKGKVFSCFSCGGGSSFGYKLAGFDVIGNNEIDPRMNKIYIENQHPKYSFCEPIQDFKNREDLPAELYQLDILDGSPPCFVAGTKVLTENGQRPIETIKVGDYVQTSDGLRKVTKFYDNGMSDTFKTKIWYKLNGELYVSSFEATPEHKFKTQRGWVALKDLDVSDNLYVYDVDAVKEVQIDSIELSGGYEHVYDIEVEDLHEFFAENILVHNCSAFSISGDREDCWGKEKKFREGQAKQVLDTLFFDFIDLAKKLQPKVVIAENVKGLLISQAIKYVTRIYNEFDEAGYYVTHNCVNMAKMGVPQKRERVFFLAIRKDLIEKIPYEQELFTKTPVFDWNFKEPEIPFRDVFVDYCDKPLSEATKELWNNRQPGDIDLSYIIARNRGVKSANSRFNFKFLYSDKVANTLAATDCCVLYDRPRYRNRDEIILCSTFPMDYNFLDQKPEYVCGMSVPPVGMAHLSSEVYNQWLSKL